MAYFQLVSLIFIGDRAFLVIGIGIVVKAENLYKSISLPTQSLYFSLYSGYSIF